MRVVLCPQCGASVEWERCETRPFCSERCQLIDLGGWIEERYRISDPASDDEHIDNGAGQDGANGAERGERDEEE